ncbi:hypothetical protein BDY19DRAFT_997569 [Irpex rosettiformis]|uniref:Uncharacterized protein n=1 Tax=Irpex rosettiformis TaxID=378272 RepID=A0ACB8TRP0_9APHY|nr:hypothetical protein BDY19DRAFT_997569 [Irpex rosettiformis]
MARFFSPSSIAAGQHKTPTVPVPVYLNTHVGRFFDKLHNGSGRKRQPQIPPTMPPFKHREVDLCPIVEVSSERFPEEFFNVEPKSTSALDLDLIACFDNLSIQEADEPMDIDPEDVEMGYEYDDDVEMHASPAPDAYYQDTTHHASVIPLCPSSTDYFFPPGLSSSCTSHLSLQHIPQTFVEHPDRYELGILACKELNDTNSCSQPTGVRAPVNSVSLSASVPFSLDVNLTVALQTPSPSSFKQKVAKVFRKVKQVTKIERLEKSIQQTRTSPYGRERRLQDRLVSGVEAKPQAKKKGGLNRIELSRWLGTGRPSIKKQKASVATKVKLAESSQAATEPEEPRCSMSAEEFYARIRTRSWII